MTQAPTNPLADALAHATSVRSEHSRGESIIDIAALAERAAELGYKSLALADTMTVSAMPDLFSACKKHGLKPILGVTLRVYDSSTWRKPKKGEPGDPKPPKMHTLKAYVHTRAGLQQLYRLLSLAHDAEHFYYEGRVSFDEVLTCLTPGDVSISTGDFYSLFHHPDYVDRAARRSARST